MGLVLTSPPPLLHPEPLRYSLDAFAIGDILTLTCLRQFHKQANNIPTGRIDPTLTDWGCHFVGAMGEYVVARELGIPVNEEIYLGGDDGVDFVYYGKTLQVKTIMYGGPDPWIVFNHLSDFKAWACIPVQIKNPVTVEILGCISRHRFREIYKPCNLGHGDRVGVKVEQLNHLSVLLEAVGAKKNPASAG